MTKLHIVPHDPEADALYGMATLWRALYPDAPLEDVPAMLRAIVERLDAEAGRSTFDPTV